MLSKPLQSTLTESLGSDVVSAQTLSGGDINDAHAIRLADGREYFLKSNRQAPPTLFPAEATGLRWLAEASALAIPDVIAVNEPDSSRPCFLVLEL
ncbi:MAG: fructosamine kinase family protein, partial [Myxococcota bacterium]